MLALFNADVRVHNVLPEWFQRRPVWYAALAFLFAIVILGTLEHILGGSAEWGLVEGDHFFLGNKIGPRVEVSAFSYWSSVCALWLTRIIFAWLAVVLLFYSYRKRALSRKGVRS